MSPYNCIRKIVDRLLSTKIGFVTPGLPNINLLIDTDFRLNSYNGTNRCTS